MIRFALKIAAVLVIGVLAYNFFLGTPDEKESSRKIVQEFKEVGVAVKDLLSAEKEKLDEGKYDTALDKIGNLFDKIKTGVEKIDPKALSRLNELERKRQDLEEEVHEKDKDQLDDTEKRDLNNEMEKLLRDTEKLLNEIGNKQK